MNAAVELRDLFRIYTTPEGDAAALQGLSLEVGEGEVVVVLGPSGSGKSTLLRIVAGFERPSAGTARVLGMDIGRLPERRAAAIRQQRLGYADQHYASVLAPELSAREAVALPLSLAGIARGAACARADELLARVGLADRAEALPGELSGGEQQRVAVCTALARRPRLLLADEPTGELDSESAEVVYRLIGELVREEGCSALIVSHDPESAAIADRVVHVRDGRVSEEEARRAGGVGTAIVVARGGWVRLPEVLLRQAGIRERAWARLEGGAISVGSLDGAEPGPARPARRRDAPADAPADVPDAAVVKAVTKRFGRQTALRELTAGFGAGRLTVVTGRSGSGKTTLLRLLAGLEMPSRGEILVLGRQTSGLGRAERAAVRRVSIALVPQGTALLRQQSARENVELGLAVRGLAQPEAAVRASEALEAVGLAERADQRVERLSAGERQRAAIARSLAARPALLLADEPTARLDQANALAVAVLLAEIARERGTAVICATHDPLVIEQADARVDLAARPASPPGAATIPGRSSAVPR